MDTEIMYPKTIRARCTKCGQVFLRKEAGDDCPRCGEGNALRALIEALRARSHPLNGFEGNRSSLNKG